MKDGLRKANMLFFGRCLKTPKSNFRYFCNFSFSARKVKRILATKDFIYRTLRRLQDQYGFNLIKTFLG